MKINKIKDVELLKMSKNLKSMSKYIWMLSVEWIYSKNINRKWAQTQKFYQICPTYGSSKQI